MEPLAVILKRFMQLLPFLTTPFSYQRFHLEFFYPYPDIWNDGETTPGSFIAPQIHKEQVASQGPASPAASGSDTPDPVHGLASPLPVGRHARSYLTWMELHHSDRNRREPFW